MEHPPSQPTFTVAGNRLTLLDTGPGRLAALIALIDRAERSLRILYYIYADDVSGRRVNAALEAAARRGVTVAMIVDGFGSDEASEAFFAPLEAAGISLCRFSPGWGRRYLLRNHQKLALADGETDAARIIVGGFNVEDDYFGRTADQAWRDLGLLVEGEAAGRLAGYFDALAAWARSDDAKLRHLTRTLAKWSEHEGPMRWLIGGPTRRLSPWARAIRADLRRAARVDVIAAYFAPSPTILRHLDWAGMRGAVRIVTAAKSDNDATIAAARFTYAGLLRKRVRVFEYQPTKLHTKLYLIDDAVHVGSANFDMRSLFINLELMLRIEDRAFSDHVRGYIDGEIAQSHEITPAVYRRMVTPWRRVTQFFSYLAVAVADPTISRGMNIGIDD